MKKLLVSILLACASFAASAQWGGLYINRPASSGAAGTGCIPAGLAGQILSDDGAGACSSNATGTGILTALGVNVGAAGSVVVNGGVLGTPSSGTLTNATGLPISTGVSGLGANVATFLGTPSGANLTSALTTPLTVGGGGTGLASGTSGGVPTFTAAGTLTSSGALTANLPVIGGGAGAVVSVGSRSGNTTSFATTSGALTSGNCAKFDASGNIVDHGGVCGGGGAAWTGITAGSGSSTTDNGDSAIVYRTAQTTAGRLSWRFTESAASVSTGTPVILQVDTVGSSTAMPFKLMSQGNTILTTSTGAPQLYAANGTAAAPAYSFGNGTNSGFGLAGANAALMFYFAGAENYRLTAGAKQASVGSTDAVGYASTYLKARGTVAAPSVITTGDDLATFGGYGYVGATNTYKEAARITLDSTGTIADTTSGIGGIIRFSTTTAGTDTAVQENFRIQGGSTVSQMLGTDGTSSNPTYSFASATGYGMYKHASLGGTGGTALVAGSQIAGISANGDFLVPAGSASVPGLGSTADTGSGLAWVSGTLVVSVAAVENSRFDAGSVRKSKGSGDAVGYAINLRKARGSVASPTVITTGDDIATFTGQAYVGGTNTYRDAAQIRFDSTGTVSDATNGVGGEIVFGTMKQGANTAAVDRFKIDQFGHPVSIAGTGNTPTMGTCGTNPSIAGTDDVMLVTVGTTMGTSCAVNFGTNWTTAPVCHAQSDTDIVAMKVVTAVGSVTVTTSASMTDSSKLHIMCRSY